MALLTARERAFLEAVARLSYSNPFLPELLEFERLALGDAFVEHATQRELRSMCGIDEEGICTAVRQMMGDE